MRMVDLIEKKAERQALYREEIEAIVRGYVAGRIPD